MASAVSMEGNVTCQDDGSWSYTWMWTCAGDASVSDVHEEFLIKNDSGMVDNVTESSHSADPGQTYIGGGNGNNRIPQGMTYWSLRVIGDGGYLGMQDGSFTAMTAPP
jgi:hypothetical protein